MVASEQAALTTASLSPRCPAPARRRSHASLVVERLLETGAIEEFVRSWRRHFLELMSPKFLPPHWDVNSRVANSDAPTTGLPPERLLPPPALERQVAHSGSGSIGCGDSLE